MAVAFYNCIRVPRTDDGDEDDVRGFLTSSIVATHCDTGFRRTRFPD